MKKVNIDFKDGLYLLNPVPFRLDAEKIAARLHISKKSDDYISLKKMIREASVKGAPKAVYRIACHKNLPGTNGGVVIEGVTLKSPALSVNIEKARWVFPFLATCGLELEQWSAKYSDILLKYISEYIKEAVLQSAVKFLKTHIKNTYRIPKISSMSPGSLNDWPIEQQKPLFKVIGNAKETAGVVLTDSFLMVPTKSISGVIFPVKTSFESCMLCPRKDCKGRRAPYAKKSYREKFLSGAS